MRAERRLARLEASLGPREAVLHWLRQAHEHGSLEAYVTSLVDEPGPSPLVALTERVAAATRAAHAREARPTVREAEHRAATDTVFLFMLVLELEHVATEAIRIGTLRLEALRWESCARTAEGASDRRGWAAWRTSVTDLATDVARAEAVHRFHAERYLDGHRVLSPITLARWRELREGVRTLVEAMATLPGGRRRRRADGDVIDAAASRMVDEDARRVVEWVRARTLDIMGDQAAALAIVERALRPPA